MNERQKHLKKEQDKRDAGLEDYNRLTGQSIKALKTEPYIPPTTTLDHKHKDEFYYCQICMQYQYPSRSQSTDEIRISDTGNAKHFPQSGTPDNPRSSSTRPDRSHTATVSSSGRQGQGAGDTL